MYFLEIELTKQQFLNAGLSFVPLDRLKHGFLLRTKSNHVQINRLNLFLNRVTQYNISGNPPIIALPSLVSVHPSWHAQACLEIA